MGDASLHDWCRAALALGVGGWFAAGGCASSPQAGRTTDEGRPPRSVAVSAPGGRSEASGTTPRPAALVDGVPVEWAELVPLLTEAAGGAVLQEVVLDRRLGQEAAARGVVLSDGDIREERERMRSALAAGPGAFGLSTLNTDQAEVAVEAVRRTRGLGEVRFEALVRRSALLRRMVRDGVRVDEGAVRLAHAVQHGPRLRLRIVTVATFAEAQALRGQLATGEPDLSGRLAALARRVSTDASARNGGALGLVSAADPSYPMVLRQAAEGLAVGELTPVLALDKGYALALVEEKTAGSGVDIEAVRPELERLARMRAEREAMDRLAAEMVSRAGVSALDRGLDRSWKASLPAR